MEMRSLWIHDPNEYDYSTRRMGNPVINIPYGGAAGKDLCTGCHKSLLAWWKLGTSEYKHLENEEL